MSTARVMLKPGREKSLLHHHPWVFSGAIASVEGRPGPGETVDVHASGGAWLGQGAWSAESQIRVRMWTWQSGQAVDADLMRARVLHAHGLRAGRYPGPQAAYRVVNAESDGLPGVIADRYGPHVVCQFLSAGAERWREVVAAALAGLPGCEGVYERSDADVRRKEGLAPRTGVISGTPPPSRVEILEGGARFLVDIAAGHKTGFYLDQRENRARVGAEAAGCEVLNCFAYTGAFGIAALAGGATRVTNVDTSALCLALAAEHVRINGFDESRAEQVHADVFAVLRAWRAEGRRFDMVVLDPPRFVESRAALVRGCRGYKDINMLACQLLRPDGMLATFSCSGLVGADLFHKVVADAALDVGRQVRILARLSQAADHTVDVQFPEGLYLKGLLCVVGD